MAKLPKLQWLPMLLEAYNEARTKSGLKPVTPGELLNDVIKEAPVKTNKKEVKTNQASSSKSTIRAKTGVRPAGRMGAKPPIKRHRDISVKTKQGAQFHSVLRELRRTRQKLAQVENLQAQLNQLQSTVERQLTELNQRLRNEANSNGKPDGKPDGKSDTQPASQPSAKPNPQSSGQGDSLSSGQAGPAAPPMTS